MQYAGDSVFSDPTDNIKLRRTPRLCDKVSLSVCLSAAYSKIYERILTKFSRRVGLGVGQERTSCLLGLIWILFYVPNH